MQLAAKFAGTIERNKMTATDTLLPPRKARARRPMECCPECGAIQKPADRERSTPQLRRFMKVIRAAYTNWNDKHPFQPRNIHHLRYWLEHKCGHSFPVQTIACLTTSSERLQQVLNIVFAATEHDQFFTEVENDRVIVSRAKSIDYATLPHHDACKLFADVEDFIEAEIGFRLPPEKKS